jgi:hypothetical protein
MMRSLLFTSMGRGRKVGLVMAAIKGGKDQRVAKTRHNNRSGGEGSGDT